MPGKKIPIRMTAPNTTMRMTAANTTIRMTAANPTIRVTKAPGALVGPPGLEVPGAAR